ncbi:hypothetical protein RNJ44_04917 [Nakaseomyces bracarensis]|uniref:CCHC-type domain-containing protein n=1 Tax=Nakaseomyces bracarensis TaxID=273131 RepID=A0ABR4NWF2_9SACH
MKNKDEKLEQDVKNLSEAMDKIAKLIIAKRNESNNETPPVVAISDPEKKKKKKKKNKIHCSFCNEIGHTRARCPKKLGTIEL